jgi:membrane-associated phospholipid phosphatase
MTQPFKTWLAGLVSTATFVTVSFQWFDRPIALLIYNIFGGWRESAELAARISKIPLATAIVFVLCGLVALTGRPFSKRWSAVAMSAVSLMATIIIKDELKFAFGRTWPDTWGPGIVSFVRDNVYGFHFFQPGNSFESFPSGHAAATAAVLSVVWILFPELRVICGIGFIAVDLGLVALNLHFLSDVIAGSFVGISTGLFTVALWSASEPAMRGVKTRGSPQNSSTP